MIFFFFLSLNYELLNNSLRIYGLSREDLKFEKVWRKDAFRLKIVDKILDDPYILLSYNKRWSDVESVDDLYEELLSQLDSRKKKIRINRKGNFKDVVKGYINLAKEFRERAFRDLTEEELDTVISFLPELWNEDSVSLIGRLIYRGIDSTVEMDVKRLLKILEKVDYAYIYMMGLVMVELVRYLMDNSDVEFQGYLEGVGKVSIGGGGNNVYDSTYAIVVDLEGDDVYKFGGAGDFSLIIDFNGNDRYESQGPGGPGFGFYGAGVIFDLKGNDSYIASSFSLGAGIVGVGVLYDGEGDDVYRGGIFSEGAGGFGIGILFDDGEGDDVYTVYCTGQGFGGIRGGGVLYD